MDKAIELLRRDVKKLEAIQKELARIVEDFKKPLKEHPSGIWDWLGIEKPKEASHVKSDTAGD